MNNKNAGKQISLGFLVAIVGAIATSAYLFVIRPWLLKWGATKAESRQFLPGDELVPHPQMETTRAIIICAPVAVVWSWLVQIGQGRGGFYSYDWIENLIGLDIHTIDRIFPELQSLNVGDTVPFFRGRGVNVYAIDPPNLLVLGGTLYSGNRAPDTAATPAAKEIGGSWVFLLEALDEQTARLIVRSRVAGFDPPWLSGFFLCLLEPLHFMMERKMMLGIKARAEASYLANLSE